MRGLVILLLCLVAGAVSADYTCERTRSSFLWEVCYDAESKTLRLNLNDKYYTYCNVPSTTVAQLLAASSKGRYFNSYIKGRYRC